MAKIKDIIYPSHLVQALFICYFMFYNNLINMPKIIVKQNIRKDAWNWWNACNKISYGEDWKQRVDKKLQNKLVGRTREQSFNFLFPYLKNLYKKEKINQKKKEIKNILSRCQEKIFSRMEKITGKKIYRENFTCFLTTFPRAPYNFSHGYVWLPIIWPKETYIRTFVHECTKFDITVIFW